MTSSPRPTAEAAAQSHPAYALLSRAHSPDTATQIFTDKIKHKPLFLNPKSSGDTDRRALRRHIRLRKKEYHLRKRKPQPLSAKEKRKLGVFKFKKGGDQGMRSTKAYITCGFSICWRCWDS